jgi:2-furoyl-CoA dehydrogenase FAD binding subunit
MKPKGFEYIRAHSVEEALDSLASNGEDAKIISGGNSLMAMLNFRLLEPKVLIDISRLEALSGIEDKGDHVEVKAAATQAQLQAWPGLAERVPLLALAVPHIGHFQTRSKGTVCGSIAHADPSSELPLCLALLGGSVVLRSKRGEQVLKAADFQLGMLSTARADDEMVVAVRFPVKRQGAGYAFAEVVRRKGDFAIIAIAAEVVGDTIRLGIGGVADKPAVREWSDLATDALNDKLNELAWELGGDDDIHASAKYRRQLVRRLGRKVVETAQENGAAVKEVG